MLFDSNARRQSPAHFIFSGARAPRNVCIATLKILKISSTYVQLHFVMLICRVARPLKITLGHSCTIPCQNETDH